MAHKKLSASSSGCWMNCPGQPNFQDVLIADKVLSAVDIGSDYAREGTAAHALLNRCLEDMLAGGWGITADKYKDHFVDVEITGGGCRCSWDMKLLEVPFDGWARYVVNDDMIFAVDIAIRYVRGVLEDMGATAENGLPPDVRVDLEVSGDLGFLGREDLGGTVDVRIVQMLGRIEIVDYKHGRGVAVHPEKNSQLLIYAGDGDCGLDDGVVDARLTIIQPRCPENEAVSSWDTTAEWVRTWLRETLIPAADATQADETPLKSGEKQCRWCRCAPHCDEIRNAAFSTAVAEFDAFDESGSTDIEPVPPSEERILQTFETVTPEKLAQFLSMAPFMEMAIKAANAKAVEFLQQGTEVPGFKIVEGTSRRQWVAGAEDKLKSKRVPKKLSHKQSLVSFTVLEKAEGGKYAQVVEELTTKPAGKPLLVTDSDKRPALPPPAEKEFDAPDQDNIFS